MAIRPIRKAVFPVAGMGTRLLPATKAMPKEMLTLVDRPLIQHVVEEAKQAGITEFIFVTSSGKSLIEDHFDRQHHLVHTLEKRGKHDLLELVLNTEITSGQSFAVRQHTALGLGHAVNCARHLIGDEPFAVILPDELFLHEKGCMSQMIESYEQQGGNFVALIEVPERDIPRYGIFAVDDALDPNNPHTMPITGMVEKPAIADAPSRLAGPGRYILQPEIFDVLDKQTPGAGGEIQLVDAMQTLSKTQDFFGFLFEGKRYDCGHKLGFIEANIAFALSRPDMHDDVVELLKKYAH
jgi:UTP--glucose-1-phosphate uridylyltransferase